ncbi:MAG: FtsX-like permease family protein [Gemmatimonadaceae bacterium]
MATDAAPQPFARWLPFEWIVAIRFLREGRVQTAFIIGGVAIGVAVIVFMSALITGLQSSLIERVLTGIPHIQLTPRKEIVRVLRDTAPGMHEGAVMQAPLQRLKGIDQWQGVVAQVGAMPEVAVASPAVTGSAVVVRGDVSRVIGLTGIIPDLYFRVVALPDKIVKGSTRLDGTDILIGTELAADLGIGVGDKLHVTGTGGAVTTLTVTGIFDMGNKYVNERSTFMALRTAQTLMALPGGVTSIDITVHDVYAAEVIAQRITNSASVEADSWITTNAQFFTAITAQTISMDAIRFFVGLSVAFGIASVLVISVVQKSGDIGILRAMGITRGQVLRIFLLQGGLLGLGGALAGSALGFAGLTAWMRFTRAADGSSLFTLQPSAGLFGWTLGLATLTGLVAAVVPALRAARLDPVVAINA